MTEGLRKKAGLPAMVGNSKTKTTAYGYSLTELEDLADLLDRNIRSGHDIPTCFNGNTVSRLIAQCYRAALSTRSEPPRGEMIQPGEARCRECCTLFPAELTKCPSCYSTTIDVGPPVSRLDVGEEDQGSLPPKNSPPASTASSDHVPSAPPACREPVQDGRVYVTVAGLTGSGKSAVAGEIAIALAAIGVPVEWADPEAARTERNMTGADWQAALDLYKPTVVIEERNIPRGAPSPGPVSREHGSAEGER